MSQEQDNIKSEIDEPVKVKHEPTIHGNDFDESDISVVLPKARFAQMFDAYRAVVTSMSTMISTAEKGSPEYKKIVSSDEYLALATRANAITEAMDANLRGETAYTEALDDPETDWRQRVESAHARIGAVRPKPGKSSDKLLVGDEAILHMSSFLRKGGMVKIPLWASGIWITLVTPMEGDILELVDRIQREKVTLGRVTHGGVFSNTSVYLKSYVTDFVLQHVFASTVKGLPNRRLKEVIVASDYQVLIWGLLCNIYPQGLNFRQPCIAEGDCNHVTQARLDLGKICWTNNQLLTEEQKDFMADRDRKRTLEEIREYQDSLKVLEYTGEIADGLSVTLRAPILGEMIISGRKWVDEIVRAVDEAFDLPDNDERNQMIIDRGAIAVIRQYSSWIKELRWSVDGNENVINDRDTINRTAESLSADTAIRDKFLECVGKAVRSSAVSIVGIPNYECPSCQNEQVEPLDGKSVEIIPLEVEQLFFTITTLRTTRNRVLGKL